MVAIIHLLIGPKVVRLLSGRISLRSQVSCAVTDIPRQVDPVDPFPKVAGGGQLTKRQVSIVQPRKVHTTPHSQERRQVVPAVNLHELVNAVARIALEFGARVAVKTHRSEQSATGFDHFRDIFAHDDAR